MRIRNIFMAALVLFATSATAQNEMADMPKAPVDEAVKVGHLDNGLTYYIRKNNYPEGKVNFYIAHKVGAVQERDDQDGLAHCWSTWLSTVQRTSQTTLSLSSWTRQAVAGTLTPQPTTLFTSLQASLPTVRHR